MQYCTNCGNPLGSAASPGGAKTVTDVKTPPSRPAPTAAEPPPAAATASQPQPAANFHAAPATAAVLDLRSTTAIAKPRPSATLSQSTPPSVVAPSPEATTPQISTYNRSGARLNNASATSKSQAIQKFGAPAVTPSPTPTPTPTPLAPSPPTPKPQLAAAPTPTPIADVTATQFQAPPVPIRQTATVVPSVEPAPPPVAAPPQPITIVPPAPTPAVTNVAADAAVTTAPNTPTTSTPPVMPGVVATAVDASRRLVAPGATPAIDSQTARKQAFELAMANAPKRANAVSVAAAIGAVIIMSGYIWFANAPKLAIHTAAAKAGFEASLPSYLPGNYSLTKPIVSAPGRITLAFSGSGTASFTITQQATTWDPQSLLDNYVSKQTQQYLAVAGQGLTIYLYNGDSADWVNRGIWYSIQGNHQLNRDQLLKIAYGL